MVVGGANGGGSLEDHHFFSFYPCQFGDAKSSYPTCNYYCPPSMSLLKIAYELVSFFVLIVNFYVLFLGLWKV